MRLFKRKKYSPPRIGSALDPYHYPEDSTGEPSATPSPGGPSRRRTGSTSADFPARSADDGDVGGRSDSEVA